MGLLTMGLCFAIVLWVMWKSLKKTDDAGRLVTKWVFSAILFGMLIYVGATTEAGWGGAFIIPIFGAVIGVILGITWAPNIAAIVASPLMGLYEGGGEPERKPFYSIAQARRKQGKYHEAQSEIRKQLEQFPNDFEGLMLLAEIYARNLRDMSEASKMIEQIVACGEHSPKNVAFALTCCADWHLEIDHNRDAAKEYFERIGELYPESEQSQQAAQRLAHLGSKQMIEEQRDRPRIALKVNQNHAGIGIDPNAAPIARMEDLNLTADELVKHLDEHPRDNEARENLAAIYADHYHRADLAVDQLEQLIGAPNQSSKYMVHCLNRMADVYIRLEADEAKARQTLGRIIEMFPGTAAAANAEKRMTLLPGEMKKNTQTQSVQLGVYDQNIGLKGQSPKRHTI
ncbi:MAG: tetratricopeptide repeat protein [Verrucomicrobiales bacterium]